VVGDTAGVIALLHEAGVVDDQHPTGWVAEVINDIQVGERV